MWQPIETAAKVDNVEILIWSQYFKTALIAEWVSETGDWIETWDLTGELCASHWMPIPEKPKKQWGRRFVQENKDASKESEVG